MNQIIKPYASVLYSDEGSVLDISQVFISSGDSSQNQSCPLIPLSSVPGIVDLAFSFNGSCPSDCVRDSQCGDSMRCCTVGCHSQCTPTVALGQTECQRKNYTMLLLSEAIKAVEKYSSLTISQLLMAGHNMTIVEELGREFWSEWDLERVQRDYGGVSISVALQLLKADYSFPTAHCLPNGDFVTRQCAVRVDGTVVGCFCVDRRGIERPRTRNTVGNCRDLTCQLGWCPQGQTCQTLDEYGRYTCVSNTTTVAPSTDPCAGYFCGERQKCVSQRSCVGTSCRLVPMCYGVCDFDLRCQHGGQCVTNSFGSPYCLCRHGFGGVVCERPILKLGVCPVNITKLNLELGQRCAHECTSDWQCPGVQKCCMDGCMGRCTDPTMTDLSPCNQERAVKQQSLDVINNLATKPGATVGDLLINSANNTHVWSLIASLAGHWMIELYYSEVTLIPFAQLKTMIQTNLSIPYISCQADGRYETRQCVGTNDQRNTTSCFCVNQLGWELISSRVFSENGDLNINCSSVITTVKGEITLNQDCSSDLETMGTAAYNTFQQNFTNQINILLLDSPVQQIFNGIRITGVRCGSVVVSFDLDLRNTKIIGSDPGIPMYDTNTRMWSVTMDLLKTTLMRKLEQSTISADPASLRLQVPSGPSQRCPLIPLSSVPGIVDLAFSFNGSCPSDCVRDSKCGDSKRCCTVGCHSQCTPTVALGQTECQRKNYTMLLLSEAVKAVEKYSSLTISQLLMAGRNMTIVEELGREFWSEWDLERVQRDYGGVPISLALQLLKADYSFQTAHCLPNGDFASRQCAVRVDGTVVGCFCVDNRGIKRPRTSSVMGSCADVTCQLESCPQGRTCQPLDQYGGYRCVSNDTTTTNPCAGHVCSEGQTCVSQRSCVGTTCRLVPMCYGACTNIHLPCQNGGQCVNDMKGLRCLCQHGFGGPYCERPILKLGVCPVNITKLTLELGQRCAHECTSDWQCPGAQKCCMDGCMGRCTDPTMTDFSPCKQETALRQQSLNVINSLATNSRVTVRDVVINSENNTHVWSLIASIAGYWSLEPYYQGNTPLPFSLLRNMLLNDFTNIPYISCQDNGQYEPRQCVGTYDQRNTTSCFCVNQLGWELITTRVFSENGDLNINCSSEITTLKGEITLNQDCSSNLTDVGTPAYNAFQLTFTYEVWCF
ncbi:uncharacterized protein LOC135467137 [Liolophura sinensis]|uniref:uncharacterized protein LOC135467137 n=1 Tax=Liolophura sinensis TaxID=3198878 RepID=UPI003158D061